MTGIFILLSLCSKRSATVFILLRHIYKVLLAFRHFEKATIYQSPNQMVYHQIFN